MTNVDMWEKLKSTVREIRRDKQQYLFSEIFVNMSHESGAFLLMVSPMIEKLCKIKMYFTFDGVNFYEREK